MITLTDCSRRFHDKKKVVKAVRDVSLTIQKGEVVGILGENGAGKTTMLRMIAALLEPSQGTITVAGFDTVKQPAEVKKRIGVLFGGETGLYDRMTAKENLQYFGRLYGLNRHEIKARIEGLSKRFGMRDYMNRRVGGFSKGMRQKVAIARALIHDPDIILFDEPTTGLDITSSNIFREFIQQLKREQKTILFSSHIMEEVQALCDSVIMIHSGEVIYRGALESLYESERSEDLNYIFMSKLVRGIS
ncbi:sodium ABC transporter ATP-binding protein NatA [Bacillus inaquosorum]|uniref:sodium ABC transporter ATP-binding protein NatA n=1 Tax=Bacillus inaquosorum TaxID=483913 RepID=UPI002281CEB1|nr:sodium ABC transporter ATP-binding protein NatA [Bacillus inaquosorum]MCY9384366.1 sodium ABC transporter ATP-binding protein NatA [Bacillus inaquosorum]MEC0538611.1 sodium ABC transporter ATP-binding protein NatA [Bacillus inaquosorum]